MKNFKGSVFEWLLLIFLVFLWGSAYPLTRLAIGEISPVIVVSMRLWIGAISLYLVCKILGKHIPSFYDFKAWGSMAATGIVGSLIPFSLVSFAQIHVASALASIYLSATPMAAAVMAHFLIKGEKIQTKSGLGVLLGVLGVVILFAPSFGDVKSANSPIWAQLMLLIAAFCYAGALIIVRLTSPKIDAIAISFGFVFCSAIVSIPFAIIAILHQVPVFASKDLMGILALGIGPTAIASILYVRLVHKIGPVLVANFSNLVPFVSIALGFVFFKEQIPATAGLALLVILGGVYLVQAPK
jgi:drug/metabolite transporter (DMT)-like permease